MKSAEGHLGRIFLIRLEEGDVLPDCIEAFAAENGVSVGFVSFVGGAHKGKLVVGPENGAARPISPVLQAFEEAYEGSAVGVLAPDEDGKPVLHLHGSIGRGDKALTGCFRPGVSTWLTGEVMLYEVLGTHAVRKFDEAQGFSMLVPGARSVAAVAKEEASVVTVPEEELAPVAQGTSLLYLHNAQFN